MGTQKVPDPSGSIVPLAATSGTWTLDRSLDEVDFSGAMKRIIAGKMGATLTGRVWRTRSSKGKQGKTIFALEDGARTSLVLEPATKEDEEDASLPIQPLHKAPPPPSLVTPGNPVIKGYKGPQTWSSSSQWWTGKGPGPEKTAWCNLD